MPKALYTSMHKLLSLNIANPSRWSKEIYCAYDWCDKDGGVVITYNLHHDGKIFITDMVSLEKEKEMGCGYKFDVDEYVSVGKKRHKYADLIHAWAEGAEVEYFDRTVDEWCKTLNPVWYDSYEYRLIPKTKEVTRWHWTYHDFKGYWCITSNKYTWEELKKAYKVNASFSKVLASATTTTEEVS